MDGDTSLFFSHPIESLYRYRVPFLDVSRWHVLSLFSSYQNFGLDIFFYTIGGPGRLASPPGFSFMNQRAFFRKNEIKIKQQPTTKKNILSSRLNYIDLVRFFFSSPFDVSRRPGQGFQYSSLPTKITTQRKRAPAVGLNSNNKRNRRVGGEKTDELFIFSCDTHRRSSFANSLGPDCRVLPLVILSALRFMTNAIAMGSVCLVYLFRLASLRFVGAALFLFCCCCCFPSVRMRTEPKITSAAPANEKAANVSSVFQWCATVDGRDGERYVVVVAGTGRGCRHDCESHKQTTAAQEKSAEDEKRTSRNTLEGQDGTDDGSGGMYIEWIRDRKYIG